MSAPVYDLPLYSLQMVSLALKQIHDGKAVVARFKDGDAVFELRLVSMKGKPALTQRQIDMARNGASNVARPGVLKGIRKGRK